MSAHLIRLALLTMALLVASPSQARGPAHCPVAKKKASLYAIGSSTMGSSLGAILKDESKRMGAKTRVWGKASSGLARPDFHDWPAKVPRIVQKHQPDIFVVSLGTNDGQHLWHHKRWHEFGGKRWKSIYTARVDAMLKAMGGAKKSRPILWLGPTAHPTKGATKRMELIDKIIAERVKAYGGRAVYLSGLAQTRSKDGRMRRHFKTPKQSQSFPATQSDGIHLTRKGVRWLLAEPILAALRPCLKKSATRAAAR